MDWGKYLAFGVPPKKRALIGGNWKCNGTVAEVKQLVKRLNSLEKFPLESEVK
jgi:triosephosphate isomerase